MKKFQLKHALLLLLAAIPAFMISCNKDEDIKLDFELTVPNNWDYVLMANEGWIYTAGRKPVDQLDSIREGLNIIKENLPNWTLDQYFDAVRDNLITADFFEETLYVSDTVINGSDFVKMISREYTDYLNPVYNDTFEVNVIAERYFLYKNSNGYSFNFSSVDTLYDENKTVFKQIMSTFQYNE